MITRYISVQLIIIIIIIIIINYYLLIENYRLYYKHLLNLVSYVSHSEVSVGIGRPPWLSWLWTQGLTGQDFWYSSTSDGTKSHSCSCSHVFTSKQACYYFIILLILFSVKCVYYNFILILMRTCDLLFILALIVVPPPL